MSEHEPRCPVLRLGPFCEGTQILLSLRGLRSDAEALWRRLEAQEADKPQRLAL